MLLNECAVILQELFKRIQRKEHTFSPSTNSNANNLLQIFNILVNKVLGYMVILLAGQQDTHTLPSVQIFQGIQGTDKYNNKST